VRADYLDVKRAAEKSAASVGADAGHYANAKEPWFLDAYHRAWQWADSTGWRP
jgi:dephospho-CoA kinase